jgi:transcriptional antiterminator RfaH
MSRMPDPFWAVLRTLPHHDRLAAECVAQRGFEIFTPKVRTKLGATPLFPCYLFVRIVEQWRVLERTMGVLSLVKFGDQPARCPDEEIARLLARADRDGIVRLARAGSASGRPAFAPGARVTIVDGPLAGFDAIYAGMGSAQRALVLMNILGAQQRPVEIAAGLLAAR